MAQREFPDARIEGKPVDTATRRVDQHGRGAIDDIAGGDLVTTGLQKIGLGTGLPLFARAPVNAKDGADAHVDVDIAAAVQRIEQTDIFGIVADIIVKDHAVVELFAADARAADTMPQHTHELIVGIDIELLHVLALYVYRTGITEDIDQSGFVDFHVDPFCRKPDIPQQVAELAGGIGKHPELLKREFIEREYFS